MIVEAPVDVVIIAVAKVVMVSFVEGTRCLAQQRRRSIWYRSFPGKTTEQVAGFQRQEVWKRNKKQRRSAEGDVVGL